MSDDVPHIRSEQEHCSVQCEQAPSSGVTAVFMQSATSGYNG